MGGREVGYCDICGEETVLFRKYFHYDIKCECHSPNHFELIRHCMMCEPKEPIKITVNVKPIQV